MLVLFGDSHSHAINFGYERFSRRDKFRFWLKFGRLRGGSLGPATNYRRSFFAAFSDRIYFTGDVAKRQIELLANRDPFFETDDRRRFVFSLGFHHPIYKSSIWKQYTIDSSDKKKRYVSHAAFREMLLEGNAPVLDLYRELRKLGVGFIVIATPPPPHASFVAAMNGTVSNEEFIALFERARRVFAEELDRIGVRYFFPPEHVANAKGFLKDKLCASIRPRDHHGNGEYGRIFLRHILSSARIADFYGPNWSVWRSTKRKIARSIRHAASVFEKKPADSLLDMARDRGAAGRVANRHSV